MNERVIDAYNIQKYIPGEKIYVKNNKTKFHYTSPEGLLSIIKDDTLFFTDIRYFNDKSENTYIFNCFRDFLEHNPNDYNVLRKLMKTIFPNYENLDMYLEKPEFPFVDKGKRVFVFCTCTDSDSLCMWNYYVKNGNYNGYNIGLNPTDIIKSFNGNPKEVEVLFGNVIYSEKDQQEEVKLVAEVLEKEFAGSSNKLKGLVLLYMYFQQYSAFFKSDKFSHEKEYRFVVSIDEDKFPKCLGESLELAFRTSNGIIVPYLKLKFNKTALKKVCLSPNTEEVISKNSIKEFCKEKGYGFVDVDTSKIPIRF